MNATGKYLTAKENILSIYLTADYPAKGDTGELILALQAAGVDMLEIGIPFSDPIADGRVIQESSAKALANGFRLADLFADLEKIKEKVKIPLVMMGYFNTVLAFGMERFLIHCQRLAIDTLIVPDLPVEIYVEKYKTLFENYGVSPVFLMTPQTSTERLAYIGALSKAFVYVVSDSRTTGGTGGFSEEQLAYFERVGHLELPVPTLIGFGISDAEAYAVACAHSQGAIIGSAFIKGLTANYVKENYVLNFVTKIKA